MKQRGNPKLVRLFVLSCDFHTTDPSKDITRAELYRLYQAWLKRAAAQVTPDEPESLPSFDPLRIESFNRVVQGLGYHWYRRGADSCWMGLKPGSRFKEEDEDS